MALFVVLSSCGVVEPQTQDNIVSKVHIAPGPLDSLNFYFSFFDEDLGAELDLLELDATLTVIGPSNRGYKMRRVGERIFRVNSEGYSLSPGEILFLSGTTGAFDISAKTTIPNSPDSLILSSNLLRLNPQYDGEGIFLRWNEDEDFVWVEVKSVSPVQVYPDSYTESFPDDRALLSLGSPSDDGEIKINPWDFEGQGRYELRVFWFGPAGRTLYDEPIQSGIFPIGSGIIEGLGYFQGFDSDTFFVQVLF